MHCKTSVFCKSDIEKVVLLLKGELYSTHYDILYGLVTDSMTQLVHYVLCLDYFTARGHEEKPQQ